MEPSSARDVELSKMKSIGSKITAAVAVAVVSNIGIKPANADFRAAQKRTYFRFVPKLIEGRDFFRGELKEAIENENWNGVGKFFEVYVSKYNGNDPTQVDQTDTYVNSKIFRPMKVFSSSVSLLPYFFNLGTLLFIEESFSVLVFILSRTL